MAGHSVPRCSAKAYRDFPACCGRRQWGCRPGGSVAGECSGGFLVTGSAMNTLISKDLRPRVVQARQDGLTIDANAARFSNGTASDQRWTQPFREAGSVA